MNNAACDQFMVLLIDEKQDVLQSVASTLSAAHYATCCCTSAGAALAAAQQNPPSLIISATNLAGLSGVELCHRIKQRPGLEAVPVMFLSAGQIPDIIRRRDPSGGTYYLRKPFEPHVLLKLVDKALQTPALAGASRV
jgi:CheY-like chemotaxis protein